MKKKSVKQPQHIHRYAYTRLRLIISELQRGTYPNKARLAELIGRTSRTVHRDLEALREDWNAPIAFDRQQNGFYLADAKWQIPELRLTEGELSVPSRVGGESCLTEIGKLGKVLGGRTRIGFSGHSAQGTGQADNLPIAVQAA